MTELRQLGWKVGDNLSIDYRSAPGDANRQRAYAAELVSLTPDHIVADGTPGLTAVRQATRTVPIIFVNVTDPVGQGFIESLARPGGNATGFALFEFSMGTKWLQILRELAPSINPDHASRDIFLRVRRTDVWRRSVRRDRYEATRLCDAFGLICHVGGSAGHTAPRPMGRTA